MKILNMPIIGLPNVGKSSLLNALMGKKVSIVTHKPHTTRTINCVKKDIDDYEIRFIDTPGIEKIDNKLGKIIYKNMQSYLKSLDNMMLVLDATKLRLEIFSEYIERSIVVINKIDYLRKPKLLPIIERIKSFNPREVFCICAKTGDGVEEILDYLQENECFIEAQFEKVEKFDEQEILQYACECVREKILLKFEQEIPYNVFIKVVDYAIHKESAWNIALDIVVPKASYKPIIIGKKAENLKIIGQAVRLELSSKIKQPGYLKLNLVVDDNIWKKQETYSMLGWKI